MTFVYLGDGVIVNTDHITFIHRVEPGQKLRPGSLFSQRTSKNTLVVELSTRDGCLYVAEGTQPYNELMKYLENVPSIADI